MNLLLYRGVALRLISSAEPPRSYAEFFAVLRSRESIRSRHTLQSREEEEQHTAPAKHTGQAKALAAFPTIQGRTSTSLKPSLADCAAAGIAVEAARLTAGTIV